MGIYDTLSCERFIAELGSNAPAPGGGGAAALVGAVGCALGSMVGSLTTGKKKYAAVEEDIASLLERSTKLQQELVDLAERDAEVFLPVANAWRMKAFTEAEAQEKERIVQENLTACCEVPLRVMECCCEAIGMLEEYAEKGSVLTRSDAGCGVIICKAALSAACLNVFVNTRMMTDHAHAEALNKYASSMRRIYESKADAIYARIEVELS